MTPTDQRLREIAERENKVSTRSNLLSRIYQTKFGIEGNCFDACLASLLGEPLGAVDYFRGKQTWYSDLQNWLAPRGLAYVEIMVKPWNFHRFPLPVLAIAGGPSPRGVEGGHAVVVELHSFDRKMVHDPHPSGDGIKEIEAVGLLVRVDARSRQDVPWLLELVKKQREALEKISTSTIRSKDDLKWIARVALNFSPENL